MSTIRRFLKGMTIASVATFLVCGLSAQAEEFCETEMIEILTQTRSVLMNSDEPDLIQAVRNASAAKNDCSDNPEALALAVSVYNWSAYQFEGDGNRMMLYSIGLETALMREALVTEASREDEAGEDFERAEDLEAELEKYEEEEEDEEDFWVRLSIVSGLSFFALKLSDCLNLVENPSFDFDPNISPL